MNIVDVSHPDLTTVAANCTLPMQQSVPATCHAPPMPQLLQSKLTHSQLSDAQPQQQSRE